MPVGNWWLVDDAQMRIMAGPFLWDGVTPWTPPAGQRAVSTEPVSPYTWMTEPVPASMTDLVQRIAALEARVITEARGSAVVPGIANVLGGTVTPRVRLKTPVRNAAGTTTTAYTPTALLIPGAVLGTLRITATAVVDAQNVDVTITSSGLITLGQASVLVFADLNP